METFADRDLATLSGGERRRVTIAQILTQDPDVYLLDEPGNHLDPQHQLDVLQLFRRRSGCGKTVVASLHDANLAMRFADRCLLLFGDGRWQLGDSASILNERSLSELYSMNIETVSWRSRPLFVAAGGIRER
jgi:iron complex transport system ATP-binding protein